MAEPLGRLTAAAVRENDDAIYLVGQATGLSANTIRRQLDGVHGKTLIANVFKEHWPATASILAAVNVKLARDCSLFPEVAAITGLSERTIARRISEAHGGRTLRTLFANEWPDDPPDHNEITENHEADTADRDVDLASGEEDPEAGWVVGALQVFSKEWGRPRQLDRILKLLGMDVPQRLRTPRFQELVDLLQRNGIEMTLAYQLEPVSTTAQSPGINTKVRLRRRESASGELASPRSEAEPAHQAQTLNPIGSEEDGDVVTSVAEFGIFVSRSDRVVHPLELEKILGRADRYGADLAAGAKERLVRAHEVEPLRLDMEAAARKISARLDTDGRRNVFNHLFEIATADGVIVPEEIEALRWLEEMLLTAPGMLDALLSQHRMKQPQHDGVMPSNGINESPQRPLRSISTIDANARNANIATSVDEIMALLFSR